MSRQFTSKHLRKGIKVLTIDDTIVQLYRFSTVFPAEPTKFASELPTLLAALLAPPCSRLFAPSPTFPTALPLASETKSRFDFAAPPRVSSISEAAPVMAYHSISLVSGAPRGYWVVLTPAWGVGRALALAMNARKMIESCIAGIGRSAVKERAMGSADRRRGKCVFAFQTGEREENARIYSSFKCSYLTQLPAAMSWFLGRARKQACLTGACAHLCAMVDCIPSNVNESTYLDVLMVVVVKR